MKRVVTVGIVLHRTNFGEADRILTIITPENGKIRVIAKGVRKSSSKLAAGVELFSTSNITYIPPKKEIGTLISSRLKTHYGQIVKDIDRTKMAYKVLKSIDKVTEDATDEDFFFLTESTLAGLDSKDLSLDILLAWFDCQVLKLTGQTPNLHDNSQGEPLDEGSNYTFDFEDMIFSSHKAGMFSASHIKLLRVLTAQNSTNKLKQLQGINGVLPSCQELLTAIMHQKRIA
jgi:DNA repair protein RecO (recombination protein O)